MPRKRRCTSSGRSQWHPSNKPKSWELRAAMSMAQLWRNQGKRNEARDLLAPVYGWFTEGFDARDLKKAKTLLNELRHEGAPSPRTTMSREPPHQQI